MKFRLLADGREIDDVKTVTDRVVYATDSHVYAITDVEAIDAEAASALAIALKTRLVRFVYGLLAEHVPMRVMQNLLRTMYGLPSESDESAHARWDYLPELEDRARIIVERLLRGDVA